MHLSSSTQKSAKKSNDEMDSDQEVVMVIAGGFAAGEPTIKGNKDYVRNLSQVMMADKGKKDVFPDVHICEKDRGAVRTPHDDPLVVEMKVANLRV